MAEKLLASVSLQKVKGSKTVLSWFSFKSARRGAILFGILAGFMFSLQGLAFAASYTSDLARAKFATTLASNPTVGILYGEVRNIETPAGYMVYRSMPFLAFLGSLWGLSVATRLLRGQEEDGRLELLLTGKSSLSGALLQTFKGLFASWVLAYGITATSLVLLGLSDKINVSPGESLFLALATLAPAAVFMTVGALTSQLAATRRKAVMYGIVPAVLFFALRSVGNVVESLGWLKYLTPFGWVDKLHPLTGSNGIWFAPLLGMALVCLGFAFYLSRRRDLSESIIADTATAKPHLKLLGGPFLLAFRLTRLGLLGWLLATTAVSGLIVALAKTASDALSDSESLTQAVGNLSGGASAVGLAFVSLSGFFVALFLMLLVASGIGRIREDEAKGYLDNFLVGSVSRTKWITERVGLLLLSSAGVCFVANTANLLIARAQNITIPTTVLFGGFNYLGPAVLMLGVGTLIFGIKPRIASIVLYAWVTWSFLIEMIGSVVKFNHTVLDSSLLRHISLVPGSSVDWKTFGIISTIGTLSFVIGILLFARRDLQAE
jgi:ABC-2 type transport system permease protein